MSKFKEIQPKSEGQQYLKQVLQNNKYNKIFVSGPSGSGKSLHVSEQVSRDYLAGNIEKIIVLRSLEPVSEEKMVGYLSGDINSKMSVWVAPALQHLKRWLPIDQMIDEKKLEFIPLEMIRGLSFENCAVICEEFQNFSPNAAKCVLTRCGKGTRLYASGDWDQSDRFSDDLFNIIDELDQQIPKFCWVELTEDDIFRDKSIAGILKVFKKMGY